MLRAGAFFAVSSLFGGAAHAQSSVTLYGLLDTGLTYTSNQHGSSAYQATNNNDNGTRWGLRGSEDLGSGLSAIFVLENGFALTTGSLGQSGREFGRQAFVGLADNQWGKVTMGRQYDTFMDYLGPFSLTGTGFGGEAFAHPFDNDNLDGSFRISNSVKFSSVNYNGLKIGGLYGFSNDAGSFAENRVYSLAGTYNWGKLNFAAGYMQMNGAGSQTAYNASGALSSDATFSAGRQRVWGLAANYVSGKITTGVIFTQTALSNATGISAYASGTTSGVVLPGDGARFNNYEANFRYAFTSNFLMATSYTYTNGNLDGQNAHWNQANVIGLYSLSVRTSLYATVEYQRASGLGVTGIGAGVTGYGHSSSGSQLAASVGIRHTF